MSTHYYLLPHSYHCINPWKFYSTTKMKLIIFGSLFLSLISVSLGFILTYPSEDAESNENDIVEHVDEAKRNAQVLKYRRRGLVHLPILPKLDHKGSLPQLTMDYTNLPLTNSTATTAITTTNATSTTTAPTTTPTTTTTTTSTTTPTPNPPTKCDLAKLTVRHFPGPCRAEITCENGQAFVVNGCINTLTFISQIGGATKEVSSSLQ